MTTIACIATTVAQFAAELRANVDAWYAQPNTPETYAAFTASNEATWKEIAAAGEEVHTEVDRHLRERI